MSTTFPTMEGQPKRSPQDARWALARRVAGSTTFARSEQLPKLLLYVCKMTIADRADEIHEHRIGVDVFGRPPDYDATVDGIVRSHATRLRQRLEQYFNTEGAHEQLRIEIPRGGYVPRFYAVEKTASSFHESVPPSDKQVEPAPSTIERSQNRWYQHKWVGPFFSGLCLAALAMLTVLHFRHDAEVAAGHSEIRQTEIEQRFWTSLFPPKGKTLIVPGDSGLVLYETLTGRDLTLGDYLAGAYRDVSPAERTSLTDSQARVVDVASRRYTSIVDLDLSAQLSHLPQWGLQNAAIVFARDLRPADAENSNLILLGSKEANPWVLLVEPSMNFILTPDKKWGFHFLNRNPQKGELAEYAPQVGSGGIGAPTVYGDVAYLPNPSGKGMVLVLSGLWMSGTQSAADFVFHGTQFSDWLKSIAKPDQTIPPFEVLIATKSLESNATDSSIIAKRVYVK